jgi:hypothetical protein
VEEEDEEEEEEWRREPTYTEHAHMSTLSLE